MAAPTTPVLDDCNRGNEAPLSQGGNWGGFIGSSFSNPVNLLSLGVADSSTGSDGSAAYLPVTTTADCEAYASALANLAGAGVALRLAGSVGTMNGYCFLYSNVAHLGQIQRITAGAVTGIASSPGGQPVLGAGDAIYFTAVGTLLTGYYYKAGVWTSLVSVTDATYSAGGKLGIFCKATNALPQLTAFGGGNYTAPVPPNPNYAGAPETLTTWTPLLRDDVLAGGPRMGPAPNTNRGDNNPGRVGRYD